MLVSVTLAVNVMLPPIGTVAELGDRTVRVGCSVALRDAFPELVE